MQIDWITVVAQAVNFLILVWLLKRFLYAPVVRAMREREEHIAARLSEADAKMEEARGQVESYATKHRELESAREDLMRKTREEVEAHRKELSAKMHEEIEEEREEWRRQARREQEGFLRDLRGQIAVQFQSLAENALGDLADSSLEEQIARHFSLRLDSLEDDEAEAIRKAARHADGTLAVLSSLPLAADTRRHLTRALHDRFGEDLEVTYRRSDDLTCGIELQAAGRSVMWSLDAYLDSFQQNLASRLEEMTVERTREVAA